MKIIRPLILILLFTHIIIFRLTAQDVKVEAGLDTNEILIGDQVNFNLRLFIPDNYKFEWPCFGDTLTENLEIVKKSKVDTTELSKNLLEISQTLILTSFDSGYYVIPPVKIKYAESGDTTINIVETEPYLLNVFTVKVDTTQAIKPIKGPIKASYTFREILPWVLLGIILIIVTGLVIYYFRRKKKNLPVFKPKPKPKLPPYQLALTALEKLRKDKLWQQGLIKNYHTELTDIIRQYIEGRFGINAVEMTTWDILNAIRKMSIDKNNKEQLKEILELADMVKFAKAKPLPAEHDQSINDAEKFVKNTKRERGNYKLESRN